ncbi:hypothetical protein ZEAMMB73_Zm00001d040671 [Zea mays]|uniref:Uncharacterized protein n=1 Tax=Zea mays TaxID=4577 RepID=A0A1D6MS30_MAIZE|nr:hypothetical protein ZEAMMB73_Zm00001d040671 [Zea mays]
MPISSCPFVRLKNFWQQLMNLMKSLFQNIRPSLEKFSANTRTRLHLLLTIRLIAQFTKLSGGLEGGSDPPAFQRAEKKRLEAAKRAEEAAAAKEAALEECLCDAQNSEVESAMTPRKVLEIRNIPTVRWIPCEAQQSNR